MQSFSVLDRAKVVDENFIKFMCSGEFPVAHVQLNPNQVRLSREAFLELFNSQLISPHLGFFGIFFKRKIRFLYNCR